MILRVRPRNHDGASRSGVVRNQPSVWRRTNAARVPSERRAHHAQAPAEADAKSLYALYQYGRLHGCVRLRWGFLDEMLPAPWVHRNESTLYHLLKDAYERQLALEVVVGSAPGWADPWARARRAFVATDVWHSLSLLADEQGYEIPRADVQLARLLDGPNVGRFTQLRDPGGAVVALMTPAPM